MHDKSRPAPGVRVLPCPGPKVTGLSSAQTLHMRKGGGGVLRANAGPFRGSIAIRGRVKTTPPVWKNGPRPKPKARKPSPCNPVFQGCPKFPSIEAQRVLDNREVGRVDNLIGKCRLAIRRKQWGRVDQLIYTIARLRPAAVSRLTNLASTVTR